MQNAPDPDRMRAAMTRVADLLWVIDGKSFWSVDAAIARMTGFRKSETWRVEPDLDAGRIVEASPGTALITCR